MVINLGIPSAVSNLGDAGRDAGLLAAAAVAALVVPFARKLSQDLTWLALRFPRGPSPAESHRPFGLSGFSFLLSEMAAKLKPLFNWDEINAERWEKHQRLTSL